MKSNDRYILTHAICNVSAAIDASMFAVGRGLHNWRSGITGPQRFRS